MTTNTMKSLAEDEHEHNQINLQALDRWYQSNCGGMGVNMMLAWLKCSDNDRRWVCCSTHLRKRRHMQLQFCDTTWSSSNSTSESRSASTATPGSHAADTKRGKVRSCWSKWWCWWYGCLLRLTLATIACKKKLWRMSFVSKRALNIVNRLTKYCVWLCDANDMTCLLSVFCIRKQQW